MTAKLESELIRTLAAAADVAPGPAATFLDQVHGRQRQRERRRAGLVVAAAAAVVVTVAAGVVGVVGRTTAQPQPGSPTGGPTASRTLMRLADARPAEQVWPEALVTLPARLPDGRAYTLIRILSGRRFLVAAKLAEGHSGPGGEVLLWEPDRGSPRSLGNPATPPGIGTTRLFGRPDVGDGYVAWAIEGEREVDADRGEYQEIWVAPLAGGPARRLAVVERAAIEPIVHIVDGHVYWARLEASHYDIPGPALFRVPLSGGRVTQVPGGRGYVLMRMPGWANTFGDATPSRLWNLADGTHRPADYRGFVEYECSPSWCVGSVEGDRHWVVRRLDGGRTLRVDFVARLFTSYNENIVMGLLEYPVADGDGRVVWDLRTGQLGTGPPITNAGYTGDTSDAMSTLSWLNPDGTMTVLDPRAIA